MRTYPKKSGGSLLPVITEEIAIEIENKDFDVGDCDIRKAVKEYRKAQEKRRRLTEEMHSKLLKEAKEKGFDEIPTLSDYRQQVVDTFLANAENNNDRNKKGGSV